VAPYNRDAHVSVQVMRRVVVFVTVQGLDKFNQPTTPGAPPVQGCFVLWLPWTQST
jgi:hypothetical protein